jgi:uncharacterized membrane protein
MKQVLNPMELLISAIVFVSVDTVYLQLIKDWFSNQIKRVQGTPIEFNLFGALMCYIFLIFGINYFIIRPKKSIKDAFLLGLVIYAVYEFTNYAVLKNWPLALVVMDTLWGGVLFASVTFIMYELQKWI